MPHAMEVHSVMSGVFLEYNKAAKPAMYDITPSSKPLLGAIMARKHNILAKELTVQLPRNPV